MQVTQQISATFRRMFFPPPSQYYLIQSTPDITISIVPAILFFITEVLYNKTWQFGTKPQLQAVCNFGVFFFGEKKACLRSANQ